MTEARGAVRRARISCSAGLVLLAGFLALAPKPWEVAGGPAFFPAGRRPLEATVAIALWWAAAANAALAVGLLASARAWARPLPAAEPRGHARIGRGALALLVLSAALSGALRWNLAHSSVWPDEAWTLRDAVSGIARPARDDPARLVVQRPSWVETFWQFERPTNHVAYSVAARASLGAWRALGPGREPPAFDELAYRLPALLAAVLAPPLLGLLLFQWGFARAGVAAAFWLAIHPWHIHHGGEGRGYSFVVLFTLAACLCLGRALEGGRWRAWLGAGAAAVAAVWSHVFSVWLVVALAGAALFGIATGPPPRAARAARLAVAGVAAGMLLFQLMAPNLAQVPGWRAHFVGHAESPITPAALGHLWAVAATGIEASPYGDPPERPPGVYPSLSEWAERRPWVYPVVLGVLPALVAAGALRALARGGPPRAVALGLAAAVPVALAGNLAAGGDWAPRFAIFGLVAVIGFGALGLEWALERVPWKGARARRISVAAGLALALAGFQAFVWPKTRLLLHFGHMPTREAMAFLDESVGAEPGAAIRGVLGLPGGNMHFELYHPWVRDVAGAADLAALAGEARARSVPLFVAYGYPHRNRRARPEPFRWLDDPAFFREVAFFHATQAENVVRVLVWTGRPIAPPAGEGAS
jgi:hypothetical protein